MIGFSFGVNFVFSSTGLEDERAGGGVENHPVVVWEREWCVVEKQVKPVKILVGDVESMQRLVGKRKSLRMGGV
uniref:Uncharacterized protein n=1 Tax=Physcomitrium patens TaxID=3218 RepID=A0A7I4CE18_PHYPA